LQKDGKQQQYLLLSIVPAAAVLLIGAYGSQIVPQDHAIIFAMLFLLASAATFMGEQKINAYIQEAQGRRYLELAEVCRAFLGGKWAARIIIQEDNELAELAEAINLLLEKQRQLLQRTQNPPAPQPPPPPAPRPVPTPSIPQSYNNEFTLFKEQLTLIIRELAPVADGDLRVRVSLSDDLVGIIADACNSFIEELAQFVKWTRYASQIITTASQSILGRSLEMAKGAEDQMQQIAKTTDSMEKIVVFMQHLSNTVHLNSDMAKELQSDIRERMHGVDPSFLTPMERLLDEAQRQVESFDDTLNALETVSTLAESLIGDLYTMAQQTYQSSVSALKTVKRLRELEALAAHWYEMAEVFTIEENENANEVKEPWLL
jgi:hypothetical protein